MTYDLNGKGTKRPTGLMLAKSTRPLGSLRQPNTRELHSNEQDGGDRNWDFETEDKSDHLTELHSGREGAEDKENRLKLPLIPVLPEVKKTISKKIIHLPMLKINLESLTGSTINEDDDKTLESTRRTLKSLLDDSRQGCQTAEIKNYEFITPLHQISDQSRQVENIQQWTTRKNKKGNKGLTVKFAEKNEIRVCQNNHETLQQDPISTVASTNLVPEETVSYEHDISDDDEDISTSRGVHLDFAEDLIIDLLPPSKSTVIPVVNTKTMNSHYADIQNTRKGAHRGCSKHEYLLKKHRFQEELMEQRLQARRNMTLSWVNINSRGQNKRQYLSNNTGYVPEPVTLYSSDDHCPMCVLYRSEKHPTPCPPNSPKGKEDIFLANFINKEVLYDLKEKVKNERQKEPDTDRYKDIGKLEPLSSVAVKQGFRGSKTPISFKIGFGKGGQL